MQVAHRKLALATVVPPEDARRRRVIKTVAVRRRALQRLAVSTVVLVRFAPEKLVQLLAVTPKRALATDVSLTLVRLMGALVTRAQQ